MKIVNPVGTPRREELQIAARPASLDGLRLALLHNGKPGGRELLQRLGEQLRSEHGIKDVTYWSKPHPSAGAVFLDDLAERTDVVVGALSD